MHEVNEERFLCDGAKHVRQAVQAAIAVVPSGLATHGEGYFEPGPGIMLPQTRWHSEVSAELYDQGDPEKARRAYQAAYGLSKHDDAFNEDARVQLHNLKLQQALVGLNVRQAAVAGEGEGAAGLDLLQAVGGEDLDDLGGAEGRLGGTAGVAQVGAAAVRGGLTSVSA